MPQTGTIEYRQAEYLITTDPARLDLNAVHDFLANQSYWAQGIPLSLLQTAVENSINFSLLLGEQQIGLARVVSDCATFAWVADVYVLPDYRGQGLSKWLMQCVRSHPALQNLRIWLLATRDAHGLYRQYAGFEPVDPNRLMWVRDPDVYQRLAEQQTED